MDCFLLRLLIIGLSALIGILETNIHLGINRKFPHALFDFEINVAGES